MSWTRSDPGAGDPWGTRHQANIRQTRADLLRTTTLTNLQSAETEASSASWTAKTAVAFAASVQGLIAEVQVIIGGLETDAGALKQYAAMVEQIQDQAIALQRRQDDAQADQARLLQRFSDLYTAANPPLSWPFKEPDVRERERVAEGVRETRSTLAQVEVRWDELARQRQAADDACIAALASVSSRGNLAGRGTTELSHLGTTELLQKLGGLSATEITILVQNNPGLAEKFWTSPPNAAGVEAWWSGLDAAAQGALVAALPIVIGNLEGVPYATRVQANKHNISTGIATLEEEIAVLDETIETYKGGIGYLGDTYEAGQRIAQDKIDALREQITYYMHLRDEEIEFPDPATGQLVTVIGHNVLLFDHAHDAIAEYSGVLDPVTGNVPAGVTSLGLYVPGINTTLGSFDGHVERSELFVDQATAQGSVGMITWKGGPFPQGVEALSGEMTDALGQRLAHFGQGLELATSADMTGLGYSAGGSIMGSAELAGLSLDRVVHVSSAGMGFGVRALNEYPATADVPHYSVMAPGDPLAYVQGAEMSEWGHGGSPLTTDGFIRLETGYLEAGDPTSGQVRGHSAVWSVDNTTREQIYNVLVGGQVELFAEPEPRISPGGQGYYTNPVMEPDYVPRLIDVEGGEK